MRRLLIRPGAIGDFIVSIPAMRHLLTEDTEVWAAGVNVPLANFAHRSRSIISAGLDRLGLLPAEDVLQRLRSFDSIVSWYGTNRPEFRELVESAQLPFAFHRSLPPAECSLSATDFFLRQVGGEVGQAPTISCQGTQKGPFAVIHPFSGSTKKNWPLDRFQELAVGLERRMPVRWCCGPEDNLPNATCIPDLYDLGCWLSTARLFIGNDSGISHLAAAVGTPAVVLFGASNPAVWAPRGKHVHLIARPNMESISVRDVEEIVYGCLE